MVKIFLLNLMCAVDTYIYKAGQQERIKQFCSYICKFQKLNTYDVVVYTEIMLKWVYKLIQKAMKCQGFVVDSGFDLNLVFANTGIVIFCKRPTHFSTQLFDACSGSDCFAYKGVKYAKIEGLWIYAVHLQSGQANTVKAKQLLAVHNLITTNNHPPSEPVFVVGDINSSLVSVQAVIQKFMYKYGYTPVPLNSNSVFFTYDSNRNNLVGLDGISGYTSFDFPLGCVDEFKQQQSCVCCDKELFDFGFFSQAHVEPDYLESTFTVLDTFCLPKKINFATNYGTWSSCFFSDHFPVEFCIKFKNAL